ncbi:hypothetical protein PAMP_016582 [Pampus punctatissimus]
MSGLRGARMESPIRTPRRPCARLPKTSASPGPPSSQWTAKCHLDPLQSGERRTGRGKWEKEEEETWN